MGGPCPAARARPSRRRSPRSGRSGRRGVGSRGRSSVSSRFSSPRPMRDVLGLAVDRPDRRHVAGRRRVGAARELRRDDELVATPLDRTPDEFLVGQRPVQLRRCRGSRARARARGGSWRSPRFRRSTRRRPTFPCSRGRSPRRPGRQVCGAPSWLPSIAVFSTLASRYEAPAPGARRQIGEGRPGPRCAAAAGVDWTEDLVSKLIPAESR